MLDVVFAKLMLAKLGALGCYCRAGSSKSSNGNMNDMRSPPTATLWCVSLDWRSQTKCPSASRLHIAALYPAKQPLDILSETFYTFYNLLHLYLGQGLPAKCGKWKLGCLMMSPGICSKDGHSGLHNFTGRELSSKIERERERKKPHRHIPCSRTWCITYIIILCRCHAACIYTSMIKYECVGASMPIHREREI